MSWIRVPSIRRRRSSSSSETGRTPTAQPPSIPTIIASDVDSSGSGITELQGLDVGYKTATIRTLVDLCIREFDIDGEVKCQISLAKTLFLVHNWYVSSVHLASTFIDLYADGLLESSCNRPGCRHGGIDCQVYLYRVRLCRAINFWIQHFPQQFADDEKLRGLVADLRIRMVNDGYVHLTDLLDTSRVPSYDWMRNVSVRNPLLKHTSLSFDAWTPDDIANSLTIYERRILRRISFSEYKLYASTSSLKSVPTLERSIAIFNSISQWVQCMVLNKTTPVERADIMTKFVNVAKRLRKVQNFNTLMAVVGGLSHSNLARLAKTQDSLSPEARKDLYDLTDLLSSSCNFSNYRRALAECRGFRIPIVGVHLKDLISLHAAIPDFMDDLINCKKLIQLAVIFTHLILDLEKVHNLPDGNPDLINLLKVYLDLPHTEDEIYNMSVRREPRSLRNCLHKTAVFADWAAGVSQTPDPEIINKHVAAMVEAVFKHYDHDKDGFISQSEFQSIVGSFPFIDSFCVLDSDHDGMISKSEMKRYFVNANSHSLAFRRGFRHNFHETTFLTPTSCSHCGKFLWGLLRQGVKCKDCGIPVHRGCKDQLVEECRRKTSDKTIPLIHSRVSCPSSGDDSSDESLFPPPLGQKVSLGVNRLLTKGVRTRPMRTVSTVSPESPTSDPSGSSGKFAGLFAPALSSSDCKKRALSESLDYGRSSSPGESLLASLASEEVFEEESTSTASDHNGNANVTYTYAHYGSSTSSGNSEPNCSYKGQNANNNRSPRSELATPTAAGQTTTVMVELTGGRLNSKPTATESGAPLDSQQISAQSYQQGHFLPVIQESGRHVP